MIQIIAVMLLGILVGYVFRKKSFTQYSERTISLTIITMLFILGLSVGANKTIVENLYTYGSQAAVIAFLGLGGSILVSWLVYNMFFEKGGDK